VHSVPTRLGPEPRPPWEAEVGQEMDGLAQAHSIPNARSEVPGAYH
jgi:hypothetical protein